jgi:hypothetical protein
VIEERSPAMAILRGNGLNEGSLLRRTLLHIGTFALGSLAIVTLLSFTLVSIAKSLLPSRGEKASDESAESAEATEGAAATTKPLAPKLGKTKRTRSAITEEESPTKDSNK